MVGCQNVWLHFDSITELKTNLRIVMGCNPNLETARALRAFSLFTSVCSGSPLSRAHIIAEQNGNIRDMCGETRWQICQLRSSVLTSSPR